MRNCPHTQALFLGALLIFAEGCRGGGGGGTQPPPPQPDFSIGLSSSSVSFAQGNSSSPVSISITPLNGFSGNVQVTLSGIPSGVTTSPSSPFSIAAGQSLSVIFGAAPNAPTGQFNLSAQGTSGGLSHSAPLSLSIQSATSSNLSRSVFLRNDSVPAVDTPPGEPPRREVVFDSAGARFFVANPAMNRIEVYSDSFPSLTSTIDAPAASSVDLSSDGSTLWIGFLTVDENGQRLFALTTSGLAVVQLAAVPLGIGTLTPANGPAAGGTSVTLTGSGFQSGTTATLGGKSLSVTFKDMNRLTFTTPTLTSGAQQLILTNPDGETVSLGAAFLAQ